MPFDMIGFSEATPGNVAAGNYVAAALGDTLYFHVLDDIALKADALRLLGVFYAAESLPAGWRLRQASLHIDHVGMKSQVDTSPDAICGYTHMFGRPLPLYAEVLNALSMNGVTEDTLIGCMVGTGKITQAMLDAVNPTHILRGVGATACIAHAWTTVPIVWDSALPQGVYDIVGMRVGGHLLAYQAALARLLIPGATDWRPGVPVMELTAADTMPVDAPYMPHAYWPKMQGIQFTYDQPPDIEMLSASLIDHQLVELVLQEVSKSVRGR